LIFELVLLLASAADAAPADTDPAAPPPAGTVPVDDGEQLPLSNTLQATFALDGASKLLLDEVTADVEVVASDREDISVTLELESQQLLIFSNRRTTWAIHHAEVVAERTEEGLRLSVHFPVRIDEDWLSATWHIEVPASLPLDLEVTSGGILVTGSSGGVRMDSTNGALSAELPHGPLNMHSVNGAASAQIADDSYSDISLSTTSGVTRLTIDGETVEPSSSGDIQLHGDGAYGYDLRTVNGSVVLVLGAGGD